MCVVCAVHAYIYIRLKKLSSPSFINSESQFSSVAVRETYQFHISTPKKYLKSSLEIQDERESRAIPSIRFLGQRAGVETASDDTVNCTISFRKEGT